MLRLSHLSAQERRAYVIADNKLALNAGWDQDILAIEPGKHSNDHMQSFYLKSPSGFWMEYGYGGREIGPDWEIKNYDQPMLWGHRMVDP